MPGYTLSKDDYLNRLRRIEGQVRGLFAAQNGLLRGGTVGGEGGEGWRVVRG